MDISIDQNTKIITTVVVTSFFIIALFVLRADCDLSGKWPILSSLQNLHRYTIYIHIFICHVKCQPRLNQYKKAFIVTENTAAHSRQVYYRFASLSRSTIAED